jgi:hypothetical protein
MGPYPTLASIIAELAEEAYVGYGEDAKWLTFDGRPMPQWSGLPEETQRHWIAGIHRIMRGVHFPALGLEAAE